LAWLDRQGSTGHPPGPDNGGVTQAPESNSTPHAAGFSQRQHILDIALSLMSQRGVDGTSMRDLASAAGLNVASLYHYFPSKRELLVAVLAERGFITDLAAARPAALTRDAADGLADLLDDILRSMLEVEDFVRLMLGEVLRGDETAHTVGVELFAATQESLERWLEGSEPAICDGPGTPAVARMLRAMIVGLFFEHVAGVLDGDGDTAVAFRRRAEEAAAVLRART
jgi:AcrR family transcriptional regulator